MYTPITMPCQPLLSSTIAPCPGLRKPVRGLFLLSEMKFSSLPVCGSLLVLTCEVPQLLRMEPRRRPKAILPRSHVMLNTICIVGARPRQGPCVYC
jgi:hypothetical protein